MQRASSSAGALVNPAENETLTAAEVDRMDAADLGLHFRDFAIDAWRLADPAPLVWGWYCDAIADHLQAVSAHEIRDLLITMPPRHGKSSLVSVLWPAWEWCCRPSTKFLTASYAMQLSVRDTMRARRVLAADWYQRRWPLALADDENLKSRYSNVDSDGVARGFRIAASVGSSVMGEGGDILIIDDPHNAVEAYSATSRATVLEWWGGSWSTRGNDAKTSRRVVVQQRLHEKDLAGHILSEGGWTHLCLPAEYEPGRACVTARGSGKTWRDPRTTEGELLCPERFGPVEVERLKKSLGSYAASGQLQQRPSPAQGGILKRPWWRWKPRADFPATFDRVITCWDLSFEGGADNSACAGYALGLSGATVYVLGASVGQMEFVQQVRAVLALREAWPGAVLVEDKANAAALLSTLAQTVSGLIRARADKSKEARAVIWSPWLEAGNIVLPEHTPWADDLVEECAMFPRGAAKDRVDALGHGLIYLLGRRTAITAAG